MALTQATMNRRRIIHITMIPLFTVLMIISAKLVIPIPFLPLTFQLVIAILSGLLLGPKLAAAAQLLYMMMGLFGIPVFSAGGGPGYLLMPSFGFILGFLLAAVVSGALRFWLEKRPTDGIIGYVRIFLIGLIGLIACYIVGATYMFFLALVYTGIEVTPAAYLSTLAVKILPYFGKDIFLLLLFSELARRLWRFRFIGLSNENMG